MTSGEVKNQLSSVEKEVKKLVICLAALGHTPDAVDALAVTCVGNTQQEAIKNALKLIAKQIRELIKLGSHLKYAADMQKTGTHNLKMSDIALDLLNGVLVHFTNQKLARTEKKTTDGPKLFAIEVLKLADPQIKNPKATVETFVKKARRHKTGAIDFLKWFGESKKLRLIYK